MLDKLLTTVATNAKLVVAGAIGAALVAGGGAVAVTQVASTTDASSAASEHANEHAALKGDNRSDTATAQIAVPKPSHSADAEDGAQGVHGACVSAVAKDDSTVGRDHGKAVSAAAKSCPKGDEAADASDTAEAPDSDATETETDGDGDSGVKPTKPAKGEHGRSAEHKPSKD